jgi:hypothetical protein
MNTGIDIDTDLDMDVNRHYTHNFSLESVSSLKIYKKRSYPPINDLENL